MASWMRVTIGSEPINTVRFRLLWDAAPLTCAAVTGALPFSGDVVHGTCSGEMAVVFLESELDVSPENATTRPQVGELLFTYYPRGWRRGHPDSVSEIYWAYGRDARPTVPGLFIPTLASVFAEHDGPASELAAFCQLSQRLHRHGAVPVRLELEGSKRPA